MQPWDQVKVILAGNAYEGQAGLVIRVKDEQVTVKMDTDGAEVAFATADLQLLGR